MYSNDQKGSHSFSALNGQAELQGTLQLAEQGAAGNSPCQNAAVVIVMPILQLALCSIPTQAQVITSKYMCLVNSLHQSADDRHKRLGLLCVYGMPAALYDKRSFA